MADVFISYKRENQDAVQRLVQGLRGAGLEVWWDQDIAPDAPWEQTIERELETAKVVIVCWSVAAVASENVKAEARRARHRGALIQTYIEGCDPPLFFGERQGVDLSTWNGALSDNRFQAVLVATRAIIAGKRPPGGVGFRPRRHTPWAMLTGLFVFASAVLGVIAGWLTKAEGVQGPAPLMVYVNGLDSTKELLVWSRLADALARRGVSTLHVDQPGTGEALRLHNLTATYDSERWASKVVDYLETRSDVDPKRIGMVGISLGGYYTPRAVACEPRFALGAVWGANHNWGEVQRKRLRNEGDRPVPHYWDHARWVWGAPDMTAFEKMWDDISLDGVVERIRVPFLVTHGANDRQISVEYAHRTYDQLVNSPKRELKIFTEREGGIEHVSVDNMVNARDFIADWIAESFGTHVS